MATTPEPRPLVRLSGVDLYCTIASGGMGEVWAGRHTRTGVDVAVKMIAPHRLHKPRARRMFDLELRALSRLDHRSVVEVYGGGIVTGVAEAQSGGRLRAGAPYFVMERLRGGTLESRPLPTDWRELRASLIELLNALRYVHKRSILHRDIKPSNLMVGAPDDLRPGLKLIDFGLARLGDEDEGGRPSRAGTLAFAPPEQLFPDSGLPQGPWTDLYAVGCTAWYLATGDVPPAGATVAQLVPAFDLPEGFYPWLAHMMARNPYDRCTSAGRALRELEKLNQTGTRRGAQPRTIMLNLPGLASTIEGETGPLGPKLRCRDTTPYEAAGVPLAW